MTELLLFASVFVSVFALGFLGAGCPFGIVSSMYVHRRTLGKRVRHAHQ